MTSYEAESHGYVCSKGYNNVLVNIGQIKFMLNGLIFSNNKSVPKGRRDVREEWIVAESGVQIFISKIKDIEKYLTDRVNEATEKNFSMFHDFKTSMSIFFNCTQNIIAKLEGRTFEEKLKNSDKDYQDLYNSLELITSQLGMIDVIINPESIKFGNKKSINIYRLFEKIKILFGHLAVKKDVKINFVSEIRVSDSSCYESIEFIPLILLDNALKYSVRGSTIEIKLEQAYNNKVKVIVKNIGPFVQDENLTKIFDKFFRDEFAEAFSKEGIGMGLWIAQHILAAHESELHYFKDQHGTKSIGLNIFEFDLPTL